MQLISLAKRIKADQPLPDDQKGQILELVRSAATIERFEIEIGCGNGHFLTEHAKNHSNLFIAGVDLKLERCLKTLQKLESHNLKHSRVVYGNATDLITSLPDAVVDLYHIYFPDPWPKARHRKRRFLRWGNLVELCRTLKPGGSLYFASDIFDYYLQVKTLLILHPEMALLNMEPPGEIFVSLFANQFAELQKSTYFVGGVKSQPGN